MNWSRNHVARIIRYHSTPYYCTEEVLCATALTRSKHVASEKLPATLVVYRITQNMADSFDYPDTMREFFKSYPMLSVILSPYYVSLFGKADTLNNPLYTLCLKKRPTFDLL